MGTLKGWCHLLGKSIAIQRQQYSAKVADEQPLAEEPEGFLANKEVTEKLQCAIRALETGMNKRNMQLLTAFCVAMILYYNGQRSGVIENVTIDEYHNRIEDETGFITMNCMHHKTSAQGPAQLVFNKATDDLLEKYYSLVCQRLEAKEGADHLLFLTFHGSRYSQVYRKLQEAITANNIKDVELPQPSLYRKVVRTDGSRTLTDPRLRNVSKHMCHSSETARKYYEFADLTDAVSAHQTILDMAKRRMWSKEETESLLKAWPLENSRPELKTCALIKQKYNLSDKTAKNMQDKWRQLAKRQQRANDRGL